MATRTSTTGSATFGATRVLDVRRVTVSGLAPDGTWPCTSCGQEHEVADGHVVTYLDVFESGQHRAIVCADCAAGARLQLA